MTGHAKKAQRCLSVSEAFFNVAFALATSEAADTEHLITRMNSNVFNLVPTD